MKIIDKLNSLTDEGLIITNTFANRTLVDIAAAMEEYGHDAYKHLDYKVPSSLEGLMNRNIAVKLKKKQKWCDYLSGKKHEYPKILELGINDSEEVGVSNKPFYKPYIYLIKRVKNKNITMSKEWLDSLMAFGIWYTENYEEDMRLFAKDNHFSADNCYFASPVLPKAIKV